MNKKLLIIAIAFLLMLIGLLFFKNPFIKDKPEIVEKAPLSEEKTPPVGEDKPALGLSNPASEYCVSKGYKSVILTAADGSQVGFCLLDEITSCEEWAFMNGECDIEGDALLIKQALIDKGLSLTDMKVVIRKHTGKYIAGSVVPLVEDVGGGYVFAVKDEGVVKILADGNGTIMCSDFEEYPDFPNYLVSECLDDETGENIKR